MTDFTEKLTIVDESTSDRVLLRQSTIQIRLTLEDRTEKIILNLCNIYYFLNSLLNLISLILLNNADIYYDNEQ